MHLIALYKTWDGHEWIDASLASVYQHVDAIVMVHSRVSWLGEEGNTVSEPAWAWCEEHDSQNKIHHLSGRWLAQEQQYAAGIEYIRRTGIPCDVLLAIDSDEIWETDDLERAKEQVAAHPQHAAYRSNMHTYLRTPFYRVHPPFGSPTTFFRDFNALRRSPRGCRSPAYQLDNVWLHHLTHVRESRELVERKIRQSCHADHDELIVENWMADVYDHLPDGVNLHPFVRWRSVWERIDRIWWSDLPKAVRESRFIREFWPRSLLMDGEQNALYRLARGRRMAVDLGTFLGSSAVILGLACERCVTFDLYGQVETLDGEYRELWKNHKQTLDGVQRLANRFGNVDARAGDVSEAGLSWREGPVDLLFVDADHGEASTRRAVDSWRRHMRDGGLIVLHDDNEEHPGVQAVVREMRSDPTLAWRDAGEYSGSLAVFEVLEGC